jgi:pentatricopeptide repeat protein
MLRRTISVEVNRALMRRSLTKCPRIPSFSVTRRRSYAYLLRFSSSITDTNKLADNNFQSLENDKENPTSLAGESSEPMAMAETYTMGITESAITRALKNEPDDEWDFIVEDTNSFHGENISEEVKELQDDEESSESTSPKRNELFHEWQWKTFGTARLLDTPLGHWTNEQWLSAESMLFIGWSKQRCIRAVILQFALLRRACYEMEYAKKLQQQQHEQHTQEQQNLGPTQATSSSYNKSFDAATSSLNADGNVVLMNTDRANAVERNFGKKMLGLLINNWRSVYTFYPDILRQNHLSPQELLDDVLTLYCGKYGIQVSEKVFRSILLAAISNHDDGTPEFAEQVLGHALELYDTGMEDCFPPTPLWNYALLSWVDADRRQATSNGVARIVRLMDELKVTRSRQTYRILFKECIQRGTEQSARDAESYLRQMYKEFLADNSRVQPDMASFIYIADAWAKSKSPLAGPRAEQIYEQMKALRSKNHLLDDYDRENRLVTCVLSCYMGVGSTAAAKKAEDFYRRTGLSIDSSSFSALISIYAKHNDADGAERIWNELISAEKSSKVNLNDVQFSASALLDAYAKARMPNKVEKAEALFNWITKNSRINVDTPCYNGTS